jgi:photosystem II stability/assembly factor-like uncharacterized protein
MKIIYSSFLFAMLLFCLPSSGNAQWDRQYPLEKLEPVHAISLHNDDFGFAVGNNDLILRLDSSTEQWNLLDSWDKGWHFRTVDYLEGTNGNFVAAGGNGMIISMEAGDNWTEITGAPAGIFALKILSTTEIVVCSNIGIYLWENNGWTNLNLPVSINVLGGFILDRNHIWAFTNDAVPVTYYTTNGGGSWSVNSDIGRPDVMRFYNAQYGIATDGRMVFKTVNGGQNWTMISNNTLANTVNDISFGASPGVLIGATLNAKPGISLDSGRTWTSQTTGLINTRSYSVAARSDSEFLIGNDLSGVMQSIDAGLSWEEKCGPTRNIVQDVHFIDRQNGFACGAKGMLLRTSDGGTHWEDISFGTRSHLAIEGMNTNDLWMGAAQRIFHSDNNGTSWTEKLITIGSSINDILPISSNRILAVSSTGIIYLSSDSGASWDTTYAVGGSQQLKSIAKIDNQRYMVTGFNGIILRSDDQGATWNSVTIPEPGIQYEQSYFLGNEGWLVTSSFKKSMWHTTDAGATWDTIPLPIDRFWDGVYFITPDTGIITCHTSVEGRAYITFNGGLNWSSSYITPFPLGGVTGVPNPNGTAWIFGFGSDIEVLPYCNSLPVVSDFTGDLFPCENDTIIYSVSSQNIDQYFWNFPGGWTILGDPNQATVELLVGKSPGTISVLGTNICGFSDQLSYAASVHLLPSLGVVLGDAVPCEGQTQTYSIDHSNVDDFVWTIPVGWSFIGDSNISSIQVLVGTIPGMVSVVGSNQCGQTDPEMLAVAPTLQPKINSITGNAESCEGTLATYIADVENADEIIWSYPDDWSVEGTTDQSVIEFWVGGTSGLISALAVNACGISAEIQIPVVALYVPNVAIVADENGLSVEAIASAYQWYLNGVAIPGATSQSYTPTESGEYYATIVTPEGCTATSLPVTVIISAVSKDDAISPLHLYPNPVSDQFFLDGIEGEFTYSIFDFTGKPLMRNVTSEKNISVVSFPEGVYVIHIKQDRKVYMTRFVVMK